MFYNFLFTLPLLYRRANIFRSKQRVCFLLTQSQSSTLKIFNVTTNPYQQQQVGNNSFKHLFPPQHIGYILWKMLTNNYQEQPISVVYLAANIGAEGQGNVTSHLSASSFGCGLSTLFFTALFGVLSLAVASVSSPSEEQLRK